MEEGFPTLVHKATLDRSPRAQQAELEWLWRILPRLSLPSRSGFTLAVLIKGLSLSSRVLPPRQGPSGPWRQPHLQPGTGTSCLGCQDCYQLPYRQCTMVVPCEMHRSPPRPWWPPLKSALTPQSLGSQSPVELGAGDTQETPPRSCPGYLVASSQTQ